MVRLGWLAAAGLLLLAPPAGADSPSAALLHAALAADPAAGAAAAPAAGDAMVGRALFIGARPFRLGASPCGACHAIGGESAPFAASLGPELSRSFEGMDAETLDGMLQDPPFPTMAPFYAGRPLAPDERADLAAFLLEASGKPAPGVARVVVWAGLLVLAALAGLAVVARRRPPSARAALRARAPGAPPRRRPAGEAPTPTPTSRLAPRAQGGSR